MWDPVADTENVRRILGVPPAGMMKKVNAGFEQMRMEQLGYRHKYSGFRLSRRRMKSVPEAQTRNGRLLGKTAGSTAACVR